MKRRVSNEQGGALLVVLISSVIMGISLASFLQYTSTQARSIKFSQTWNAAIPVAEAGVEEAMAHINGSTIGTNFAINGWTIVSNEFEKAGTIGGSRYVARITSARWPVVTSVGYTTDGRMTNQYARTVRVTTTRASTGLDGIVARANVVMNGITEVDSFDSQDENYATQGRYDRAKRKDGGYVASVNANVTGSTIYGTVGTGPTGTATGNVGTLDWLGSNSGIQPGAYANDVNRSFPIVQPPFDFAAAPNPGIRILTNFAYWSSMVTTATLPSTPPASPITTNLLGTNTILYPAYPPVAPHLVTTNWSPKVNEKTEPDESTGIVRNVVKHQGKYDYELLTSYSYPTVTYTYSMMVSSNSMTTNRYTYVLEPPRTEYQLSNLRLTGGESLLAVGGDMVLFVRGDFSMIGNSELIIAPGASLKIYVEGKIDLAGNGILNYTSDASKFSIFGLPSNREIAIGGNASFTGVIYAPQAHISLDGGGGGGTDVVGAIVANSVEMNGNFQFHYDESLRRAQIIARYTVASWAEL